MTIVLASCWINAIRGHRENLRGEPSIARLDAAFMDAPTRVTWSMFEEAFRQVAETKYPTDARKQARLARQHAVFAHVTRALLAAVVRGIATRVPGCLTIVKRFHLTRADDLPTAPRVMYSPASLCRPMPIASRRFCFKPLRSHLRMATMRGTRSSASCRTSRSTCRPKHCQPSLTVPRGLSCGVLSEPLATSTHGMPRTSRRWPARWRRRSSQAH